MVNIEQTIEYLAIKMQDDLILGINITLAACKALKYLRSTYPNMPESTRSALLQTAGYEMSTVKEAVTKIEEEEALRIRQSEARSKRQRDKISWAIQQATIKLGG